MAQIRIIDPSVDFDDLIVDLKRQQALKMGKNNIGQTSTAYTLAEVLIMWESEK